MNHRGAFLMIATLFVFTLFSSGNPGIDRPNVIIIYGDDIDIQDMGRGPIQLYNLRTDPSQRNNLALDYAEILKL